MIDRNGPTCTYNPALVAQATGRDQLALQRRYGEYISATTFRRLLAAKKSK